MIFVCLGNPGEKYSKTRHNVGKMFGQYLIRKRNDGAIVNSRKSGEIIRLENNWKIVFLNCFMNESGNCLKKLLKFINHRVVGKTFGDARQSSIINHLYLIHDDLDIPFGEFKIQFGKGAAGHHGVESVIENLGTKDFWRIRIGIGKPPANIEPEDFVLMLFGKEEKTEKIFVEVLQELKEC